MKKTHILLIVMLMLALVVLTACATDNGGDVNTDPDVVNNDDVDNNTDTDSATISRGEWNGNVYTNDYAGVTFTKPDDWVIFTDEELATLMGTGADILAEAGMDFNAAMMDLQSLYDMCSFSADQTSNVSAFFEKIPATGDTAALTVNDYYDSLSSIFDQVYSTIDYTTSTGTKQIGDATYDYLLFSINADGQTMDQYYFTRSIDEYMFSVIVTLSGATTLDDVLAMFS